jgi:3-oxoacyl-[acyl-carrier protein] reductase
MTLDEATCVVTGASRGIGRGIAERLADEGASVAVNYRSSEAEARAVAAEIREAGGEAFAVRADVTDPAAVAEMGETVRGEIGPVDVLVNNAGITVDTKFANMSREEWDQVMDVNLGGVFTCTKEFYDDLLESESGRLINISSVIGKQGNYGQANYATAKSALFGFTRSLALEMAPHGATANCVAPGYTETEMVQRVREDIREQLLREIPLNRFAAVEEVAATVGFLASDDAGYISGEVIDVNGAIDL